MKHLKTIFIVALCIVPFISDATTNYSSAVGKKAIQSGCAEVVNQIINQ